MARNRFWLLGMLLVGFLGMMAIACGQSEDSNLQGEDEIDGVDLPEHLDLKAEQSTDETVIIKGRLNCGDTVTGTFTATSNIHGYKFTGYAGKKYSVNYTATYAASKGVVIGFYDEETAKRVAYTRKDKDSKVKISYTAENYTGYSVVVAPRTVGTTGTYSLNFTCSGNELTACYDSSTCKADEFCAYLSGCGKTSKGLCRKKPVTCSGATSWVCGCDGNSYGNECQANKVGVSVFNKGKCSNSGGTTNNSSTDVNLIVDKKAYSYMDTMKVTFSNRMKNTAFLPGCSVVYWEKQNGNSWTVDGPDKICVQEGTAQEVKSGAEYREQLTAKKIGTWRLAVTYGAGCDSGQPLSRANCLQVYSVRSTMFTIKDCPSITMPTCPGGKTPVANYDAEGICITSYTCPADPSCHPVCLKMGTSYEGWYDSCTNKIINDEQGYPAWDDCANCTAKCRYSGTMNEGWYNSCNGYVISYCKCS